MLSHAFPGARASKVFDQTASDRPFTASGAAELHLKDRGFTVGPMQGGDPRGVFFGEAHIGKWRTIQPVERLGLHGQITGDHRNGPVIVTLFDAAPNEAVEALRAPVPSRDRFGRALDHAINAGLAAIILISVGALGLIGWHPVGAPPVGKITLRAGAIGLRAAASSLPFIIEGEKH